MKIFQIISIFVISTISFLGCQRANHFKVTKAPTNQQSVGLLVELDKGASSLEELKASGMEYRVLNSDHGLYEIFSQDESHIEKSLNSLKTVFHKNKYYPNIAMTNRSKDSYILGEPGFSNKNLLKLFQASKEKEGENTEEVALPPIPEVFKGCIRGKASELPAKILVGPGLDPTRPTTNLGTKIDFSGAPHPEGKPLTYSWQAFGPTLSNQPKQVQKGMNFSIEANNVGAYQFAHVAKTDDGSCSFMQGIFLVTHNPKFILPTENGPRVSARNINIYSQLILSNGLAAREKATGKGVRVAILDSGLNFNHPAIHWNLAVDKDELNGKEDNDNNSNAFENDYLGWDFINGDNNVFDDEGHGSHVAGITGSHVFGLAPDAEILPVKVLNAMGGGDIGSIAAGIIYAVDNGADIINGSLGSAAKEFQILSKAIEYAEERGVLFVAASGNGDPKTGKGLDLDAPGIDIFPAELQNSNVMSIASSNEIDGLTGYSNFGHNSVEIAAPGGSQRLPAVSITTQNEKGLNLIPNVGTSMAAPVVAGLAALALELDPDLEATDMKHLIFKTGKASESLNGRLIYEKVVDAEALVNYMTSIEYEQDLFKKEERHKHLDTISSLPETF